MQREGRGAAVVVRAQLAPRARRGARTGAPGNRSQPRRRPAYVARLLALGHQLRGLLDSGEVAGVGELARRLRVSQPRVTQIVNLTWLAPRIQAEIAALEAVDGVEPMGERVLREVLREVGWVGQGRRWADALASPAGHTLKRWGRANDVSEHRRRSPFCTRL